MRITTSSENMIGTVLLFLPCMTCLFWFALNTLAPKKSQTFKALELLLAVTGIALFSEAGLTCTKGNMMLSLFLIKQFFALLIIPAAFAYTLSHSSSGETNHSLQGYLAIPASLLVAQIILLILTGADCFMESILCPLSGHADKAAKLINLCSFWIFHIILAIEVIVFIAYSLVKAIKGDHQIQLINTSAAVIIYAVLVLSVIYVFPLWIKAVLSIILACIIFMLSYSEVFKGEKLTKPAVIADQNPVFIPEKTTDVHQSQADEDYLRIRFEDLIVSEQLFLKQGIRLSDIASMLDTNRTYVSRLVNNTYNMSFSDYINTLRIDYAEQYLLHHRDAKQSDIATACGFPNASAFNNVFKKITGVTPKIWLATKS